MSLASAPPTDRLWERHANPASGWTRLLAFPVLVYSIYARRRRLLAATAAFLAVNPVLFPPLPNANAWMTRAVLGERMWYRRRGPRRAPDLLNAFGALAAAAVLYAASRRKPALTVVSTAAVMILKLAFVAHVARFYGRNRGKYPEDVPTFDRVEGEL